VLQIGVELSTLDSVQKWLDLGKASSANKLQLEFIRTLNNKLYIILNLK
jgi:hypothetical protein